MEAKRLCANTRLPGMTWVAARLFRVRALLARQSGYEPDYRQFDESARNFEQALGLPAPASVPLDAASEGGATGSLASSVERAERPAADLELPLLPVHPACALAVDWDLKEGIVVTTGAQRRRRSLGFGFVDALGLGRAPIAASAIASIPIQPLTMLQQHWPAVARWLTDLLLDAGTLKELGDDNGAPIDVRVNVSDAILSLLPWELMQRGLGPGFLSAAPRVRYFYRGGSGPSGDRATMLWVQHVLRQMFDRNLSVDGADSQRTRDTIRAFQDGEKLPVTGTADSRTRWALDRACARPRAGASARCSCSQAARSAQMPSVTEACSKPSGFTPASATPPASSRRLRPTGPSSPATITTTC